MNNYQISYQGKTYKFNGAATRVRQWINHTVDWEMFGKSELVTKEVDAEDFGLISAKLGDVMIDASIVTSGPNRVATSAQKNYLAILRVDISEMKNLTVAQASNLIDAAKNDQLGSVSGFYTDGSN